MVPVSCQAQPLKLFFLSEFQDKETGNYQTWKQSKARSPKSISPYRSSKSPEVKSSVGYQFSGSGGSFHLIPLLGCLSRRSFPGQRILFGESKRPRGQEAKRPEGSQYEVCGTVIVMKQPSVQYHWWTPTQEHKCLKERRLRAPA